MKWELHAHTAESSICGKIPAAEAAAMLAKAGYAGMVVTDHYTQRHLDEFTGTPLERAQQWLRGYETAREAGERLSMTVLFGLEARLPGSDNDYLIFGVRPDFVLDNPELHLMDLPGLSALCRRYGALLVQAHPFRKMCTRAELEYLDGVEVHNGNPRHDSRNDLAAQLARDNPRLIPTSGSDFHQAQDLDRGGVYIKEEIRTEAQLADCLRARRYELITF